MEVNQIKPYRDKGFIVNLTVIAQILVLFAASACSYPTDVEKNNVWRCGPYPEGFSKEDLVGTWREEFAEGVTDTLILHENGTFEQVLGASVTRPGINVKGRKWYMEKRPSGGIYIHLEGMRYCLSLTEICMQEVGGGGDWLYYDPCGDRVIHMVGEVILSVANVTGWSSPDASNAPRGIALVHMRPESDMPSYYYILQE